jgi:hypothetical protein
MGKVILKRGDFNRRTEEIKKKTLKKKTVRENLPCIDRLRFIII